MKRTIIILSTLALLVLLPYVVYAQNPVYLPLIVQGSGNQTNGTVPPVTRYKTVSSDISFKDTEKQAITYVDNAPNETKYISNVVSIDLQLMHILPAGTTKATSFTYRHQTSTVTEDCIQLRSYWLYNGKYQTFTEVTCYEALDSTLIPSDQYADAITVLNTLMSIYK